MRLHLYRGKTLVSPMRNLLSILLLVLAFAGAAAAHAQGGPPFITDDPGTPGNRHWEINFGWVANHNPGQSYYEIPDIDLNYGWGDRIQLKYELPLAAATNANNSTGVDLGESFPGVKWRFYEHHRSGEPPTDANLLFSLGTYPQVSINNPTRAAQRAKTIYSRVIGVVGPQCRMTAPRAKRKCGRSSRTNRKEDHRGMRMINSLTYHAIHSILSTDECVLQ